MRGHADLHTLIRRQCYGRQLGARCGSPRWPTDAAQFLRSSFAAGFPLFGPAMYSKLGNGWATGVLAFLCAAFTPLPFVFYHFGARLRKGSKFAAQD